MTHSDGYLSRLSDRMAVVLQEAREGVTTQQTAEHLGVSSRTVERYRRHLVSLGINIDRPPRVPRHGTLTERRHYNCKCAECRAAENAYMRNLRGKPILSHGASGYRRGCRCPVCFSYQQAANRQAKQRRQERGAA